MSANPAIRRLLAGLGAMLLAAGCVAGAPSSTSSPAPSMPTAAPPAEPSPTPVPTVSASPGVSGCVSLNIDYGADARGKAGDPVDLTRTTVDGLQAGDVVEPGDPTETGVAVRILRAGEVVGDITYASDGHGGWLLMGGMLCAGLGAKS